MLASGSLDNTVKLWNARSGVLNSTLKGHSADVYTVCYSPDGQTIASGSGDSTIKLWEAATGKLTATLNDHESDVLSVCFSPDGTTIASGGGEIELKQLNSDCAVRLWDASTGALKAILPDSSGYTTVLVCYSPDGKSIVAVKNAFDETSCKLWDATSRLEIQNSIAANWKCMSFAPDGNTFAASFGGAIQLFRKLP
jgi:WD40 repeat protein